MKETSDWDYEYELWCWKQYDLYYVYLNFVLIFFVLLIYNVLWGSIFSIASWEIILFLFFVHGPQGYCSHSSFLVDCISFAVVLAGYSTRLLHLLQQPSCFWDLVMVGVKIWEIIPKCFRYFLLKIPSHPSLTVPDLCTIFFLDFRDSVLVVSAWFCSFGWWILRCV